MGIHWGDVLTIVYLSPLCHGYSLKVSWHLYMCLQYVMGTHGGVLTIVILSPLCHGYSYGVFWQLSFVSIMSWVLIVVSWQLSICLNYVIGNDWACLVNPLFVSNMSWVLIRVSWQLSICLHYVIGTLWGCLVKCLYVSVMSWGTYWGCFDNGLFVYIMSWVLIGCVLTIVCFHY